MDLHEDNSHNMMNRVISFYAKKLGCTLTWVQESGPKCSGKEKFEDFKNLSAKLKGNSIGKELMEEGCPIPNCQERTWTVYFNSKNKSSSTLNLSFPHYTKVLVRNEIKLYTFSSSIADIGGFLGLLLGESLVSYVLLGTYWMKKIMKK